MGYILSRAAEEDLINILLAGAQQFGFAQAEKYHQLLEKTFRYLAENPYVARQRIEIKPPVRVHPVGVHMVLYVRKESGDIFIVRVRHGREDWLPTDYADP